MAKKDIWMPLNIGDYLADTMSLTAEQHGVYLLLLMDYWKSGPLADDDRQLAATGKVTLKVWRDEVGPVIRRFFFIGEDGHLHQKRADLEVAKTGRISRARRNAALDRHGKTTKVTANDMQRECKTDANAPQEIHKTGDIARVHALALPSPLEKKETSLREAKKIRAKPRSVVPPDWTPDDVGIAFAQQRGVVKAEVSKFINFHTAKGNLMADWNAAWRTWCENAVSFGTAKGVPQSIAPADTQPSFLPGGF